MAHFIVGKRRQGPSMVNILWFTSIISTSLLFVVFIVGYGMDINLDVDAANKNQWTLAEKQRLVSREETLLGLAAELETELAKSRRRIKRRLDLLDRRKMDNQNLGAAEAKEAIHGRRVLAPPQRLKRRLMDAPSSLGREVGPGLSSDGSTGGGGSGGDRNDSKNRAWAIVYPDDEEVNEGVKANAAKNNTKSGAIIVPEEISALREENIIKDHHRDKLFLYDFRPDNSTGGRSDAKDYVSKLSKTIRSSKMRVSTLRRKFLNSTKSFSSNEKLKSRQGIMQTKDFLHESNRYPKPTFHRELQNDMATPNRRPNRGTFDRHEPREATRGGMFTPLKAATAPLLGCGDLARVNSRERIGSGYTKRVEKARLGDGRTVAVKSVLTDGEDVQTCKGLGMTERDCVQLANYKLLKEIAFLMQLQHPNILKLLGFCMNDASTEATGSGASSLSSSSSSSTTSVVVELGTTLTFLGFLQMPWEERFRACLGVSRLLAFLADSPIGSLAIHDFKMVQFVLVDGEVKLADLDDVDDGHRPCSSTADCGMRIGASNDTVHAECRDGACINYNEISNLVQAHATFFSLLQFDAPKGIADSIGRLLNNTKRALLSASQVTAKMEQILDYYREGRYLKTSPAYSTVNDTQFQVIPHSDLAGSDDYWCPGSRQLAAACVLSVHDAHEAMAICARDRQCRAFVMTTQRTWTGRTITYFKKGVSISPQSREGNILYIFSR